MPYLSKTLNEGELKQFVENPLPLPHAVLFGARKFQITRRIFR
jgi:hypothetical protein